MKDSGLLFVNIGNSFENQFKSFDIARDVVDSGFLLVQPIIWVKGHHSPVQGTSHLNHLYEYIFLFSKTENYALEPSCNRSTLQGQIQHRPLESCNPGSEMPGGRVAHKLRNGPEAF